MSGGQRYLFIDGAHLRERFDATVPKWVGSEVEPSIDLIRNAAIAYKCFYYDCAAVKRKAETDDDFAKRRGKQERLFSKFRRSHGTHVKLGELRGEHGKIRQKGVDVMLAVDMMNHAFRGNLERAILITGDHDFVPVVKSLVDMGVFVEVWGDKSHTASELADAADTYQPLSFWTYFGWLDRSNLPPTVVDLNSDPNQADRTDYKVRKTGTVNGCTAYLLQSREKWAIEYELDGRVYHTAYDDYERCLKFAELQVGPIDGLMPS